MRKFEDSVTTKSALKESRISVILARRVMCDIFAYTSLHLTAELAVLECPWQIQEATIGR